VDNIAGSLKQATAEIQQNMLALWTRCDDDLGKRLKTALAG